MALTLAGVRKVFGARQPCRIAIEVGTHSPWLSRELERLGYEVIVANARQVGLIARGQKKTDRVDAETLARAARFDPQLLRPSAIAASRRRRTWRCCGRARRC